MHGGGGAGGGFGGGGPGESKDPWEVISAEMLKALFSLFVLEDKEIKISTHHVTGFYHN